MERSRATGAGLGAQLWTWDATGEKTRLLAWCVVALLIPYNVYLYYVNFSDLSVNSHGDFFLYWSFGRFVASHPFTELYSYPALHDFQESIGSGPGFLGYYVYPPQLAFLLAPLARLDYAPALLVWCFGTLLLYLWAAFGRAWNWRAVVATLLLPPTAMCMAGGQNGFLTAALLIGGLRLTPTRPILAGVLFGLLAYKPQFGVLVPVALASARQWRAMASAAASVLVIVVTVGFAAGWSIWALWFASLRGNAVLFTSAVPLDHMMPTVMASVNLLGGPPVVARVAQLVTAVATVAVTWACFRRGMGRLPMAALLVGAFLVTPYAEAYDMPIVATAIVVVIGERIAARGAFTLIEIIILLAASLMPALLPIPAPRFPTGATVLVLLFAVIVYRLAVVSGGWRGGGLNSSFVPVATPPPIPLPQGEGEKN